MITIRIITKDHSTVTLTGNDDTYTYHHGGPRRIISKDQFENLFRAALRETSTVSALPCGNELEVMMKSA